MIPKAKNNKGAVVRYERVEIWGILFWKQQYSKKIKNKKNSEPKKNLKKTKNNLNILFCKQQSVQILCWLSLSSFWLSVEQDPKTRLPQKKSKKIQKLDCHKKLREDPKTRLPQKLKEDAKTLLPQKLR